ncbi:hypothetical protein X280_01720 [Oenococcus oeni IOEB_0502]|nr:hypothetical protein X280_01720 [Oenococcus oeni IOEB_0502]
MLIFFGVFESLLGIAQHFLNNTFFNTYDSNGTPIFLSIFYSNGLSSSDPFSGSEVRAFGTMDSGLTLGVFVLLSMALVLSEIPRLKKRTKLILLLIFLIAIYSTLTRNIYTATLIFIFFYLFKKNSKKRISKKYLKLIYVLATIVCFISIWLQSLIQIISQLFQALGFNVNTFSGRFIFLQAAITRIKSFSSLLFGAGMPITSEIPVDNSMFYLMLQFGLILAIIFIFFMYGSFLDCLKNDSFYQNNYSIAIFMLLFPFVSYGNNIFHAFCISYIILILFFEKPSELDQYIRIEKTNNEITV